MEQDKPKIDQEAHFELRMRGERHAAEVYERTGDLVYALLHVSDCWEMHPHLTAIYNRHLARELNGGTLPKVSDFKQDDENQAVV